MSKRVPRTLGGVLVLLLLVTLAAPTAQAQVMDRVVIISYLNLQPAQAGPWVVTFKKHLAPALEELKKDGTLQVWHLFVPGIHHPGNTWTHALVLVSKDRAAQAAVEKKLQEAVAAMPAEDAKAFYGAIDANKHFDDEWREVDFDKIQVPDEPEEKEGEQEGETKD